MKRFATDSLILIAISACVAAVMLLPPRTMRRIDRNWGRVIFDDPVTFATAERLADMLVKGNEFDGRVQTYRLTKEGDTTTLAIVVQREKYEKIFNKDGPTPTRRDHLINSLEILCYEVFPDERMHVVLMDEKLKRFGELIAPTLFETQRVGRVKSP